MSCYRPIRAWQKIGKKNENGKNIIVFKQPYDFENWEEIQIPCGKCIGCKLEYSKQWAVRCVLESKNWEYNYFLTLTYEPENLPLTTVVDKETGEVSEVMTLNKKDLQKFLKRLRERWNRVHNHKNIRFYACGEYGKKGKRPHYHIILFNLPIYDLKFYKATAQHERLYTSQEIENLWGKGFVTIGEVNFATRAYVRRYCTKKIFSVKNDLVQKEFTTMSLKPGIGEKSYNSKIWKNDEIIIPTKNGRQFYKPPKYFEKLAEKEGLNLEEIKNKRKASAINTRNLELSKTDLNTFEYSALKEREKIKQIQSLKRSL